MAYTKIWILTFSDYLSVRRKLVRPRTRPCILNINGMILEVCLVYQKLLESHPDRKILKLYYNRMRQVSKFTITGTTLLLKENKTTAFHIFIFSQRNLIITENTWREFINVRKNISPPFFCQKILGYFWNEWLQYTSGYTSSYLRSRLCGVCTYMCYSQQRNCKSASAIVNLLNSQVDVWGVNEATNP